MSDLVTAIRAAIDETERIAQGATPGPWRWNSLCPRRDCKHDPTWDEHSHSLEAGKELVIWAIGYDDVEVGVTEADAAHIAHHDPATVMRRCAADRKILDLHAADRAGRCHICMWDDTSGGLHQETAPCPTIRALAEAYDIRLPARPPVAS